MRLLTENIWETITRSVRKRLPNYVAVAYFGADGANLLPLKKGDVLVVDASENTVKRGATDPKSLHILLDKGVKIFSKERLHAKMMVLGDMLFLGSANVSSNSKYVLHEAVIQTDDPKLVQECISYINDLPKKELSKNDLIALTDIYIHPIQVVNKKKHRVANSHLRIYPLEFDSEGFSEGVIDFLKKGKAKARQEISSDETLDILEVEFDETTASLEFILQMEKRGEEFFVYPPSEVIHKEIIPSKKIVLLFMVRKKGKRGIYKNLLELKLRRKITSGVWMTEYLSIKVMELWKMSFN